MGPEWAERAMGTKILKPNSDALCEQTADVMELRTLGSRNPIAYTLPDNPGETELGYLCLKCDYYRYGIILPLVVRDYFCVPYFIPSEKVFRNGTHCLYI
jgi:hypothetical protein